MRRLAEYNIEKYDKQYELLRLYYDNAPEGLISFSEKGIVTDINKKMTSILDMPTDEIIGLHFTDVFEILGIEFVEVANDYKDIINNINMHETDDWKLTNLKCNDHVLDVSSILLIKNNEVHGFTLHALDTTKKKKDEDKLRECEKRQKEIISSSKVIGWEYDIRDKIITWSDDIYKFYERELKHRPPSTEDVSNFEQTARKKIQELGERFIRGDIEDEYYFQYKYTTNKKMWYKTIIKKEKDRFGRVIKFTGILQNAGECNKYEDLKRILRTISQQQGEESDLNSFMEIVNNEIKEVLHLMDSYIVIQNPEMEYIQIPTFNKNQSKTITDFLEPVKILIESVIQQNKILQAVAGTQQTILGNKKETDIVENKRIWIGIPLKCEDEVLGVFVIEDRYFVDECKKDRMELLECISYEIAKAVRLHQCRIQIERIFKDNIILTKEIRHRVYNNLQIIIALLNLQKYQIKTKNDAIKGLKVSQDRIVSMSMVCEQFYES
jgi:PAS domain S-box-containing protein